MCVQDASNPCQRIDEQLSFGLTTQIVLWSDVQPGQRATGRRVRIETDRIRGNVDGVIKPVGLTIKSEDLA